MNFRITRHAGWGAPENALDLLWERLGPRREEASFVRGRSDIRATWGVDVPIAMERDEREEVEVEPRGRTSRLARARVAHRGCDPSSRSLLRRYFARAAFRSSPSSGWPISFCRCAACVWMNNWFTVVAGTSSSNRR